MWGTSRLIMDRLNIFNLNSIQEVAEEKMILRRWAASMLGRPEHISGCACPIVFKFHTHHL